MEAYITLTEVHGNRWELTVRLPVKWLQQFTGRTDVQVFDRPVDPYWGFEYTEGGITQPWHYLSQVYCTLERAEQAAAGITGELANARDSLKPKGFIKYTLDLSGTGPIVPLREGNRAEDNEPF